MPNYFSFAENKENQVCGVYFTGVGCSHCAKTDPVVLQELFNEYPNLIIIEYEIYQQRENALLFDKYSQSCELSRSGIPMIIFNHQDVIIGDNPILNNIREKIEELENNSCLLINGDFQKFEDVNLASLPGKPKIWTKDRILIKNNQEEWVFGWKGEKVQDQYSSEINPNKVLQNLIITDNFLNIINQINYTSTSSIKAPLSGSYIDFNNAISFKVKAEPEIVLENNLDLVKVLSLALVDAINPCALAVLGLMLITILSYNPQKKRNVLLAGLAFIISVFIMYLLYGLVIIRSFEIIQSLTSIRVWLYKLLGAGAIILGIIKLKDFFKAQSVCNVVPKVNKIIARITSPAGAFIVGAFVTIFLLPCTIGPYVICGGILCPLGLLKAMPLLLLYNLIFVLPMIVMVLVIYLGLSQVKDISTWQAKNIKYLDLISGIVIIGLGVAMIFGLL